MWASKSSHSIKHNVHILEDENELLPAPEINEPNPLNPDFSNYLFMKLLCFTLMLCLFSLAVKSQPKRLARAKKQDVSLKLYSKKKPFTVLDSIKAECFFYCVDDSNLNFYKVYDVNYNRLAGYAFKDSVEIIDFLSKSQRKKLIISVFDTQRVILEKWNNGTCSKEEKSKLEFKMSNYMWNVFIPISGIFSNYYKQEKDTSMLRQFIETMNTGNELELGILTDCFVTSPTIFLKFIGPMDGNTKEGMVDLIDFGLQNKFSGKKSHQSALKKYESELKAVLDTTSSYNH